MFRFIILNMYRWCIAVENVYEGVRNIERPMCVPILVNALPNIGFYDYKFYISQLINIYGLLLLYLFNYHAPGSPLTFLTVFGKVRLAIPSFFVSYLNFFTDSWIYFSYCCKNSVFSKRFSPEIYSLFFLKSRAFSSSLGRFLY